MADFEIPDAAVREVAQLHREMAEYPERYPTDDKWQARELLRVALPTLKRAWWNEVVATKGRPAENDVEPQATTVEPFDIRADPVDGFNKTMPWTLSNRDE